MNLLSQDYFCAAPWVSLYVDPSGRVDNCCVSHNSIGNVNKDNINDIIKGPNNLSVKDNMLKNQHIDGCNSCFRNNTSHRQQNFYNREWADKDESFYKDIKNFSLEYLDLRWNNTCNFACIYCGAGCSSLWADIENKKLNNKIPIISSDQKTYKQKEELLKFIVDNAKTIKYLYLAGGEPLMLKENIPVIDAIISAKTNCNILVNTNLSLLEGNQVFEKLKQHNNVTWLLSCEAVHEQYEYIRWPGVWKNFDQNLEIINSLKDHHGHRVSFNLVVMNLNALSVWDFIDYASAKLKIPHQNFTANLYNLRESSGPFAIQRLPETIKQQVKQQAQNYTKVPGVYNLIDALDDPCPKKQSNNFGLEGTFAALNRLDRERGLDSSKIFKDIYNFSK